MESTVIGLMAALGAVGSTALAQNRVTLYGEIDASAVWVNNVGGGHAFQLASGLIDGIFCGMQGSEDLGGGGNQRNVASGRCAVTLRHVHVHDRYGRALESGCTASRLHAVEAH
ncbi:porin [Paraburkholderia sp. UYCP14C]|nr:porin [Paraburkholderia sp. UYCP14C]